MIRAKALESVVVTELGVRGAVAVCGQLLSQLGATVIAVENPRGEAPKGVHRAQYMAGKLSFLPQPDSAADLGMLDQLINGSDILLTSSDVDPIWLRRTEVRTPSNVLCDITAFGSTGTLAGKGLSELAIQALSGIMDTTGYPDGPPVPIRMPIADVITGTYAASAALAAHRVRRQHGEGQFIDMALFDGAFATLRTFLTTVLTSEKKDKSRLGNRHPTVAPWNLYRSRDGFVLICAGNTFGMFERLCKLIGHPEMAARFPTQKARIAAMTEMDPAIEGWTQQFTTAECVEKLLAVGVVSGPIAPVDAHPREDNLEFRGMIQRVFDPVAQRDVFVPGSPLRMSVTPGVTPSHIPAPDENRAEIADIAAELGRLRKAPASAPKRRSLDGVRIVEFGQYTTAPMCSRELAHLGAEVIKIENPAASESRAGADQINGIGVSFKMNNADKKTIAVDLNNPFDLEVLKRLIATADVLVENLKPGTLAKFGFTPADIHAINPRLVYCAISGFGTESMYPTRPAFDMVITAMAGFMSVLSADGLPLKSGISTADIMGAEMAMVAILGALDHLERTGEGQYIDLSMQDVCAWLTQTSWNHALDGRIEPAVVKASDGFVLVEAGDAVLREALRTGAGPSGSIEDLAAADRETVVEELARLHIEAIPVQTVREASRMAHTLERQLWFTMEEDGVSWPMLASPLRLTGTPPTVTHLAVPMNNDREALLLEVGLTPPETSKPEQGVPKVGS